jgi:hypothetical protein
MASSSRLIKRDWFVDWLWGKLQAEFGLPPHDRGAVGTGLQGTRKPAGYPISWMNANDSVF